ncbi:hypothetical protein M8C21_013014, partial [Ambrosia artemisiifolia]
VGARRFQRPFHPASISGSGGVYTAACGCSEERERERGSPVEGFSLEEDGGGRRKRRQKYRILRRQLGGGNYAAVTCWCFGGDGKRRETHNHSHSNAAPHITAPSGRILQPTNNHNHSNAGRGVTETLEVNGLPATVEQDAKKGVLFIDFPPVPQLQLKRFEYDFTRDMMVKINDRAEFPLELDRDRENDKYLSPDADKSVRNLYTLHRTELFENATVSERVVVSNEVWTLHFLWLRTPSTEAETQELRVIYAALQGFNFGLEDDGWRWEVDGSGIFSVRSVREMAERSPFGNKVQESVWNNWAPTKFNFLLWRLIQDRFPTAIALAHRNVHVPDPTCRLCNEELESAMHLFFSCRFVSWVWEFVSDWCRLRPLYVFELKDFAVLHKRFRGSKKWKKAVFMIIQASLWLIWKWRNEIIFNGKRVNIWRLKEEIKRPYLFMGQK